MIHICRLWVPAVNNLFSQLIDLMYIVVFDMKSVFQLSLSTFNLFIYNFLLLININSANIENLVEEAKDMKILTEKYEGEINRCMSNSFGFGGTNCSLMFDRYEE